jgi:hypothetical protein
MQFGNATKAALSIGGAIALLIFLPVSCRLIEMDDRWERGLLDLNERNQYGSLTLQMIYVGAAWFCAVAIAVMIDNLKGIRAAHRNSLPGEQESRVVPSDDKRLAVHRPRLHECARCGHRMRSSRWRCPKCGQITSAWTLPSGMLSDFARQGRRESTGVDEQRAEAIRLIMRLADPEGIASMHDGGEAPDVRQLRRLYFVAAKRLHPDRNEGQHVREWFQLQEAAEALRPTRVGVDPE